MVTIPRSVGGDDALAGGRRVPSRYRYDHDRGHDWAALDRFAEVASAAGVAVSADEFMWMQAAEFADGRVVHAYKHVDTRRYLHIDGTGHAYRYTAAGGVGAYVQWAGPRSAIGEVLEVQPAGVTASDSRTATARSILAQWSTPPAPVVLPSVGMEIDL